MNSMDKKAREYWDSLHAASQTISESSNAFINHQRKERAALLGARLASFLNANILEAGCGSGDDLSNVAKSDALCVGLDYSATSLRLAKTKHPSLDFILGDVLHLPFRSSSFELVFNSGVLEHFRTHAEPLKEMVRVVRKGGYVLAFVPNALSLWTLLKHLTNLLCKVGKGFHGWPIWEKSFCWFALKRTGKALGLNCVEVKGITLLHYSYVFTLIERWCGKPLLPKSLGTKLSHFLIKLDVKPSRLSSWFGMEIVLIGEV